MKKNLFFFTLALLVVFSTMGAGCSGNSGNQDNSKSGGVFKSADSGATWSQITAYPTSKGVGNIGAAEVLALAIDPQDHEVVYAGTSENGLLMSYDSGASWQAPKATTLQEGKIVAAAVDPKNVCAIYAASDTRLYKTEDCGRSFNSVYDEARNRTYLRQIATDWYNDGVIYLGLSNGDVLKSSDGGESWTQIINTKKEISALIVSNQDSRVVLAGTDEGLWKSVDGGASWTDITDILKSYRTADEIYSLVQTADGTTWLLSSKYGILRSSDAGESWSALKLLSSAGQVEIKGLVIDPKDANNIYYAAESNFYSSTDGGSNWDTQKLEANGWIVSSLLIDPVNPSVLYLGKEKNEK